MRCTDTSANIYTENATNIYAENALNEVRRHLNIHIYTGQMKLAQVYIHLNKHTHTHTRIHTHKYLRGNAYAMHAAAKEVSPFMLLCA